MVPVLRHAEARDLWSTAAEVARLAEATAQAAPRALSSPAPPSRSPAWALWAASRQRQDQPPRSRDRRREPHRRAAGDARRRDRGAADDEPVVVVRPPRGRRHRRRTLHSGRARISRGASNDVCAVAARPALAALSRFGQQLPRRRLRPESAVLAARSGLAQTHTTADVDRGEQGHLLKPDSMLHNRHRGEHGLEVCNSVDRRTGASLGLRLSSHCPPVAVPMMPLPAASTPEPTPSWHRLTCRPPGSTLCASDAGDVRADRRRGVARDRRRLFGMDRRAVRKAPGFSSSRLGGRGRRGPRR